MLGGQVRGKGLLRRSLCACLLCGLLVAPSAALAEVDPNSVTTSAEVEAVATDGGGGSQDRDRSTLGGFSKFERNVKARDANSDSGRIGRAEVTQNTVIVQEGNEFLGVDSNGVAEASFTDPDPSPSAPTGTGISELDVGFDVVNAPVQFVMTGRIEVFPTATGAGSCSTAFVSGTVGSVPGVNSCSGPASRDIDIKGTLNPGSHQLGIDLDARADPFTLPGVGVTGSSLVQYDLKLRFCTVVAASPGAATVGTAGNDVICGREGDEQLLGIGGSDRIFGFGGDDDIAGGEGPDRIDAGEGDDVRVYGGVGNDTIDAGPGDDGPAAPDVGDVVAGGPGDDEIDGGPGNDRILGRCGEAVHGTPSPVCGGDPPVPGENEDDNLDGGTGNDILFGDAGKNVISGSDGNDFASAGDLGDTILLGKGSDRAAGGAGKDDIDGGPGDDNAVGAFSGLNGLGGGDRITGGTGDDLINGDAGGDDLFGEGGSDTLTGSDANDCLVGGSRKDVFEAGDGDDTILAKDGERDSGSGGSGPDRGRFDGADTIGSVAVRNFQGGC